ncbi:MAG: TRAP transporter substrate-binding protein [Beijerinckiaceae bacterium]|nr:TRAP transporter substrate-binding protein [Beijerinckiaceae bacterium]
MKLDRRLVLIGGGSALAAPFVSRAHAQAPQTLRLSHTDTPVGSRQQAAELFAKKVAEYTGGAFQVQVFHSGQVANDPKAIEQLQLGGLDFTISATGSYAPHVRGLNLAGMPFLVDSYEQGWKLYDESKSLKFHMDQLPGKGLRVLSTWEAGFRSFTTKDPLASPADAKGKRMRVFPNDMIRWIMEAIGFVPVVLPVTEVYLAIQQGVVIGQENPTDTIYSLRFYEVAPNITLTRHVYSPLPMTISEITWRRLDAKTQEAVTRAAGDAAKLSRQIVRADEEKQLAEMTAKGAKIAKPVIAPFREAVKPVYDKARETFGPAIVDGMLADCEAIRRSNPA